MTNLIMPHGSNELNTLYIEDEMARSSMLSASAEMRSLEINSAAAANAVMMAAGYFNPLTGYMNKEEALKVSREMLTLNDIFWPVPIVNITTDANSLDYTHGEEIALKDPNVEGNPVIAIQRIDNVEKLSDDDIETIVKNVFGTTDVNHPGVKNFKDQGKYIISGPIEVLNYSYFPHDFPNTFATAPDIRMMLTKAGWSKTVAFQTRNPMHRAHEELCKMAYERLEADGVLIHMLLGKLKEGDIPGDVRDAAIRKMVEIYFEENTAIISGFGFDMMYAGPREALLHAVFRQNAGCTHLIVGRDHAGVGDYYEPFDAQDIFDKDVVRDSLKIEIFKADHTAYSKKLNKVVMMRDAEDHTKDDFVLLSGTKVREMLAAGQDLPPEFARKEVAQILMTYYQQKG
jgi:sulfate adenylyltransferase